MTDARRIIGVMLLAIAAGVAVLGSMSRPTPMPPDDGELDMRGAFVGPTAMVDAVAVSAHWLEVADEIEWDGMQAEPFLKTGHSLDVLRTRARELRWRGQRVGERQPTAQKIAHDYLDKKVGIDGGPLTPEKRAQWVNAYRQLGKAAAYESR